MQKSHTVKQTSNVQTLMPGYPRCKIHTTTVSYYGDSVMITIVTMLLIFFFFLCVCVGELVG